MNGISPFLIALILPLSAWARNSDRLRRTCFNEIALFCKAARQNDLREDCLQKLYYDATKPCQDELDRLLASSGKPLPRKRGDKTAQSHPAGEPTHKACAPDRCCFFSENAGSAAEGWVTTPAWSEVTLTCESQLENASSDASFPYTLSLEGHRSVRLFSFWRRDPRLAWKYNYNCLYQLGSANAVHDDQALYRLPFAAGKTYSVIQGYGGKFSHHGIYQYSIDFAMPVGTPVHAAREGIVIHLQQEFKAGGPDPALKDAANNVSVRHSDGTIGSYVHLKHGGAAVSLGQSVKTGQLIGYSGNTGYSKSPHLHFHVHKPVDGRKIQTLPVRLKGLPGY